MSSWRRHCCTTLGAVGIESPEGLLQSCAACRLGAGTLHSHCRVSVYHQQCTDQPGCSCTPCWTTGNVCKTVLRWPQHKVQCNIPGLKVVPAARTAIWNDLVGPQPCGCTHLCVVCIRVFVWLCVSWVRAGLCCLWSSFMASPLHAGGVQAPSTASGWHHQSWRLPCRWAQPAAVETRSFAGC